MVRKKINYAGVKQAHNIYVDSYVTAFLHIQYNTTYMVQLTTKVIQAHFWSPTYLNTSQQKPVGCFQVH